MHTTSSFQSRRSLELSLPRERGKQPVDSYDFKDPCDMREMKREREKQRTGEAHLHYLVSDTLRVLLFTAVFSVSVSSKVVRICQQTTPVHVLTSRKSCGTNLRTKVLDCLALLCFLLTGLTSLSFNPSGKHLFVPRDIKLLLFPRRLRISSTLSFFQG